MKANYFVGVTEHNLNEIDFTITNGIDLWDDHEKLAS